MDKEKAELSWKKKDFVSAGEVVPDSLRNDPLHTEGELMTEDELADWLKDTLATFSIIRQNDKRKFEELFHKYVLDIQYLAKIGKITADEEEELIKKERFEF